MKITLTGEESLRIEPTPGPLTIEAASHDQSYSPFHMHRVGSMKVVLDWPSLSAELWPRAVRAASLCGVHKTLTHSIEISVDAVGAESPAIEAAL